MNPILQLALLQLAVPVLLIVLNALVPAASWWSSVLRALLLAAGLVWLVMGAIWLYPPWWTPYVLVFVALASFWFPIRRLARNGASPRRWWRWISAIILVVATALVVVLLVVPAAIGRVNPGASINLASPLEKGAYLVVNGGSSVAVNKHLSTVDSERWSGQSRAVDLVKINGTGLRAKGISPTDPADYFIFGEPVYAPCDGTVVATRNDLPDLRVPDVDRVNRAGNYILIRCGKYEILLAHLQRASVSVSQGERVVIGSPLGKVGNSGDTSEPHLHLHAQQPSSDPAKPFAAQPEWFTVKGRFLVRNSILRP